MSAEATFWAWSMGVKSSAAKLVLLCLADCHNSDTERCDPSAPFILKFTGLDKKTIPVAIKWLCEAGLISVHHRKGTSSQHTLHISTFPAPVREKGERRTTLKIKTPPKKGSTQKRGDPKNGSAQISPETPPENGGLPPPKTGVEPTKNLQGITYNSSESNEHDSAALADNSVDNSWQAIGKDYLAPTAGQLIFNRGAEFLGRYGIESESARSFLGMCKRDHGEGRTLDAVVCCLCAPPERDPKAWIQGILKNQPKLIDTAWEPEQHQVDELAGLGIAMDLIRHARDIFVTWFNDMEISHSNWPNLFRRWVIRDWEIADAKEYLYRQRLTKAAGPNFVPPFRQPSSL